MDVRSAIIDPNFDDPAAPKIPYTHDGAKRKRSMGRSKRMHVEIFATRRFAASMTLAIPCGEAVLYEGWPLNCGLLHNLISMCSGCEPEEEGRSALQY